MLGNILLKLGLLYHKGLTDPVATILFFPGHLDIFSIYSSFSLADSLDNMMNLKLFSPSTSKREINNEMCNLWNRNKFH
jgi:hypothetical protein